MQQTKQKVDLPLQGGLKETMLNVAQIVCFGRSPVAHPGVPIVLVAGIGASIDSASVVSQELSPDHSCGKDGDASLTEQHEPLVQRIAEGSCKQPDLCRHLQAKQAPGSHSWKSFLAILSCKSLLSPKQVADYDIRRHQVLFAIVQAPRMV